MTSPESFMLGCYASVGTARLLVSLVPVFFFRFFFLLLLSHRQYDVECKLYDTLNSPVDTYSDNGVFVSDERSHPT